MPRSRDPHRAVGASAIKGSLVVPDNGAAVIKGQFALQLARPPAVGLDGQPRAWGEGDFLITKLFRQIEGPAARAGEAARPEIPRAVPQSQATPKSNPSAGRRATTRRRARNLRPPVRRRLSRNCQGCPSSQLTATHCGSSSSSLRRKRHRPSPLRTMKCAGTPPRGVAQSGGFTSHLSSKGSYRPGSGKCS